MARLLKGKKGQIVDFVIVLIVLFAVAALLSKGLSDKDKIIEFGGKQYSMFDAYAEGEKALEYLQTAGELTIIDVLQGKCDATLTDETIAFRANGIMNSYIRNYNSSNPELSITMPSYYTYSAFNDVAGSGVWLIGIAGEDITITSDKYRFTYSVNGNFRSVLSCDKLKKLKPETASQQLIG